MKTTDQAKRAESPLPTYEWGLVLSGGGYKGVGHIAVLEHLRDVGALPDVISGSSAGALVGAFYAAGYNSEELMRFFKEMSLIDLRSFTISKPGLLDVRRHRNYLEDRLPERFDQLDIPLHITATDILHNRAHTFSEGDLISALLASCAVPMMFCPIEVDDSLFVDGGVMDNFPVHPIQHVCNRLAGSYVAIPQTLTMEEVTSTMKVVSHATALTSYSNSYNKFDDVDLLYLPPLSSYSWLTKSDVDEIYDATKLYCSGLSVNVGS